MVGASFGRRLLALRPALWTGGGERVSSGASRLRLVLRVAVFGALVDVRRAFTDRRLGTFSSTLGLVALVALVGTLFGTILKRDLESYSTYIPWLGSGLIVWMFFIGTIGDTCGRAVLWARVLRHAQVPLPAVPLAILFGKGVVLAQNMALLGLGYLVLLQEMPVRPLSLALGLVLLTIDAYALALAGFLLCLRFRSLSHTISWATQVGFLLTPLLWPEYFLGRYQYLNDLNPLHHLIMLMRAPLLGRETAPVTWMVGIAVALIAVGAARLLHRRARRDLSYWL